MKDDTASGRTPRPLDLDDLDEVEVRAAEMELSSLEEAGLVAPPSAEWIARAKSTLGRLSEAGEVTGRAFSKYGEVVGDREVEAEQDLDDSDSGEPA